jgi:hypothetical protein
MMQKCPRGTPLRWILVSGCLCWFLFSCSSGPSGPSQTQQASVTQTLPPTVQVTPTSAIAAGTVLYQANWSKGLGDWKGDANWSVVDGQLQARTAGTTTIRVPYQPASPFYAIETRVRIVQVLKNVDNAFTIFADDSADGDGYQGGINTLAVRQPDLPPPGFAQIAPDHLDVSAGFQQIDYVPATNWHVYRVEVRGNTVSLSIDGATVSTGTSREKALTTSALGLKCTGFVLRISSYRVTAL